MSGMNYSRHTNRNITYNAPRQFKYSYLGNATKPTAKQMSFYNKLYAICKKHNLETCRHNGDRSSYAAAINIMLKTLEKARINSYTGDPIEAPAS